MSVEENKVMVREYFEAFAGGDLGWMDSHIAPDFVRHDPGLPFEVRGPEGVRHLNSVLLTAFPDMRLDVEDVICEGDKVLARLTIHATHRGEFMEIPPTGNEVEVPVLDLFRIADGKLVEHWAAIDNLGMMRQLGRA
ncbi:MAG: ester cyclase [Rubrobacteraceae bacterium]